MAFLKKSLSFSSSKIADNFMEKLRLVIISHHTTFQARSLNETFFSEIENSEDVIRMSTKLEKRLSLKKENQVLICS